MNAGFWQGKRVLVTGHTGFLGSWLGLWLAKKGAQVRGISLAPKTDPSLFVLGALDRRVESRIVDIREFSRVQGELHDFKPEIVFHLAAQSLVRESFQDPLETFSTNVMGTANVLEACRKTPSVRSVIVATSDKCYENREIARGYREDDAMGGHDPYSGSKGSCELVTSSYRRSFFSEAGVGLATARIGNAVGGGDWSDRLVPNCVRSLVRKEPMLIYNPGAIRPWQHVLEPLNACLRLAEMAYEDPSRYSRGWNLGPDSPDSGDKSVTWMVETIARLWGDQAGWKIQPERALPHEAQNLRLDSSLARKELGWSSKLTLTQSLEWALSWYRSQAAGAPAADLCLEQIERFEALPSKA